MDDLEVTDVLQERFLDWDIELEVLTIGLINSIKEFGIKTLLSTYSPWWRCEIWTDEVSGGIGWAVFYLSAGTKRASILALLGRGGSVKLY